MRAVVQRVKSSAVTIDGQEVARISKGLNVLLGVGPEDGEEDVRWLADKIVNLRIFEDEAGKMNRSVLDIGGELLLVSQFTLFGDCRHGRRPGFSAAAPPELAVPLYEKFKAELKRLGLSPQCGVFQADMLVDIANDGPVTLLLDSKKTF